MELSLRRLTSEVRAAPATGRLSGRGQPRSVEADDGAEAETIRNLTAAVVGVGLGTDMGYGHLRLDPALPPYLLPELSQADQEHLRARWAEGMEQLINFLTNNSFRMLYSPHN